MSDGSAILSHSMSSSFAFCSSNSDCTCSLPHFMLQQFVPSVSGSEKGQAQSGMTVMTIINFNLLPGGVSRNSQPRETILNRRFSDIILESMKLLLNASLIRKKPLQDEKAGSETGDAVKSQWTKLQTLMDFVEKTRKSDEIMMGGFFPQLIARKSSGPWEQPGKTIACSCIKTSGATLVPTCLQLRAVLLKGSGWNYYQ